MFMVDDNRKALEKELKILRLMISLKLEKIFGAQLF